ncbi:MAG: hypothetical protein ACYC7A_10070 [Thermoanaerobaculia bacterium]
MDENERFDAQQSPGPNPSRNPQSETLENVLAGLGLTGPLAVMAMKHLGPRIGQKMENFDPKDILEHAQSLFGTGKDRLRSSARSNPKLFYGGLAAAVLGVSLMATALRRGEGVDVETDITTHGEVDRPDI